MNEKDIVIDSLTIFNRIVIVFASKRESTLEDSLRFNNEQMIKKRQMRQPLGKTSKMLLIVL